MNISKGSVLVKARTSIAPERCGDDREPSEVIRNPS
jgi:hypothetical protein